jgi:hypothetical protein
MSALISEGKGINLNIIFNNYVNVNSVGNNYDSQTLGVEKIFKHKSDLKASASSEKHVYLPEQVGYEKEFLNPPASAKRVSSVNNLKQDLTLSETIPKETQESNTSVKQKIEQVGSLDHYEVREVFEGQQLRELMGYLLVTLGLVIFVTAFFGLIIVKNIGSTGHILLDFLSTDNYYCFLIPMMVPVTVITVYSNWVAMKFFRHT